MLQQEQAFHPHWIRDTMVPLPCRPQCSPAPDNRHRGGSQMGRRLEQRAWGEMRRASPSLPRKWGHCVSRWWVDGLFPTLVCMHVYASVCMRVRAEGPPAPLGSPDPGCPWPQVIAGVLPGSRASPLLLPCSTSLLCFLGPCLSPLSDHQRPGSVQSLPWTQSHAPHASSASSSSWTKREDCPESDNGHAVMLGQEHERGPLSQGDQGRLPGGGDTSIRALEDNMACGKTGLPVMSQQSPTLGSPPSMLCPRGPQPHEVDPATHLPPAFSGHPQPFERTPHASASPGPSRSSPYRAQPASLASVTASEHPPTPFSPHSASTSAGRWPHLGVPSGGLTYLVSVSCPLSVSSPAQVRAGLPLGQAGDREGTGTGHKGPGSPLITQDMRA